MSIDEPGVIAGHDLTERIKTARNRCDIALILIDKGKDNLLPTILEDLFYGSQIILDRYCVKEEKNESAHINRAAHSICRWDAR